MCAWVYGWVGRWVMCVCICTSGWVMCVGVWVGRWVTCVCACVCVRVGGCAYVCVCVCAWLYQVTLPSVCLQFGGRTSGKKGKPGGKGSKEIIDPEASVKIDQMQEEELDQKLSQMLDEMNVTNDGARQDILGRPLRDKQNLLKSYWLRTAAQQDTPEGFLKELSQEFHSKDQLFQVTDKLRISLTNNGLG